MFEFISILTLKSSVFPVSANTNTAYLIAQFTIWMSSLIRPSPSYPTFNQLLNKVDSIFLKVFNLLVSFYTSCYYLKSSTIISDMDYYNNLLTCPLSYSLLLPKSIFHSVAKQRHSFSKLRENFSIQ